MKRVSWAARGYIALVVLAAVVIVGHLPSDARDLDLITGYWAHYLVLAALFLVCDSTPTALATRDSSWSASSAAALAAVVLLGPVGAALVGAVSVLSVRKPLAIGQRLFSGAMYALSGYVAGYAFLRAGGHAGVPGPGMFPRLILPFAVAAVVHVACNHVLVWVLLRLRRRHRGAAWRTLREPGQSVALLVFSDLGLSGLGLIIAALWEVTGRFAAAIVLVPLYVSRWAMGQFARQAAAHSATIAALCQAVETKDFYTRGHSERVSRGAGMIARQIGMRADRAEAVRFAGMLHDVGKLGVPTKVLQKTGPLTEEEYAAIQLHPMRGLEIVREIGFLNEALTGIMHHHERVDGRGYPMGFAGDEIPVFARIIAVADAFDSMTSTRSYRQARKIEEAVAELRRGAGTQFDPKMVGAFVLALERDGWRPGPIGAPRGYEIITAQDHDDPIAPLRVVERR